jgi:replicative DNA helicase|tara:strand:+ start:124 stop:1425 length:1302 start_codon:yes stop_codon:yes gene_type:complete
MNSDRLELERILLGKLINNPQNYYDNHSLLNHSLFENPDHIKLFKLLEKQYQDTGKIDLTEFYMSFADKSSAIQVAQKCTEMAYDGSSCQSIILILNQISRKKELKMLCLKTIDKIDNDEDLFDTVDYVEKSVQKIGNVDNDELCSIGEQMPGMLKGLENNMKSDGMTGIPSGFPSIDKFTSGWQKQDLVIIGGASSMGKTSFALNVAMNASNMGHSVVIFSYEMSVNQMLMRMISGDTNINNKHLLRGTIYEEELTKIHNSVADFERLSMYIDECRNTSLKYLLNRIRQYVIAKKVEMVVVDYLQLISYSVRGRTREQEVSQVARALKNIAKELDITVVALSQLSRSVSKRETGRPNLSDLRESGEIEQAADVVAFVYRPEYYGLKTDDDGNSVEGMAEIIFAKGRNIGIGSKYLKFIDYLTKFEEISTFNT